MANKTLFALMFLCSYAFVPFALMLLCSCVLVAIRSTNYYVRNYKKNMQNEPKFRKSQMNITNLITKNYDKKDTWSSGKKQSQTNPNKAKFKKAKMNVTSIITKDYENKSSWAICENEPKTNPILVRHQCGGSEEKNAAAFDD